jgi:hypothetical protein
VFILKVKVMMRLSDAQRQPNFPVTREQYRKLVKEVGLDAARAKRIEMEMEEA